MKNLIKSIISLILVVMLLVSSNTLALNTIKSDQEMDKSLKEINNFNEQKTYNPDFDDGDLDKLVNLEVTVTIKEIRVLDDISLVGNPNLYVKVLINDVEFKSPVWRNKKYIKANWSTEPLDVDDTEENVSIKIQVLDWNIGRDKLCDISNNFNSNYMDKKDLDLVYSLKTGHWRGDDYNHPDPFLDVSGYGRANGCDDNSIYKRFKDCEIWFEITQNDYDGDGIPYWVEEEIFGTDSEVDNTGWDNDSDGVPIEWEYKWGHYYVWNWHSNKYESRWEYYPFEWEDHANLDPDNDGLQNIEEFLTSQWGSDPFRQDIFLELDQMEISSDGRGGYVPELSLDLLRDPFARRNIVFHIDDGCMGGGQKDITFDPVTDRDELQELYLKYFLNDDPDYWRRGVFHYALIIYYYDHQAGFAFSSNVNDIRLLDCFTLITNITDYSPLYKRPIINIFRRRTFDMDVQRAIVYASVMMHETGHVLGIYRSNTPGCDNGNERFKYIKYLSCMNYRYVYHVIDYSDGRRGRNDFDDWGRIDLTLFETER